jgi:hypothetical protein
VATKKEEQAAIDLAEAEAEAQNLKQYKRSGTGVDRNAGGSTGALNEYGLVDMEPDTIGDVVDPSIVSILYHSFDGRTVVVPSFMAPKLLASRLPDSAGVPNDLRGTRVWYTTPRESLSRLNLLCMLHEDQDELLREEFAKAGVPFGICTKNNIPSEYSLRLHMEKKHRREYSILLESRERDERNAERAVAEKNAEAMMSMAKAILNRE